MESNNFISLSRKENKKLLFGVKMIPDKAMDRLTDNLFVCIEKSVHHWDKYYIAFKKKSSNTILVNSHVLTKKGLKAYIDFLHNFYESFDFVSGSNTAEFDIEGSGTVTLKILHSNYFKISSKNISTVPCINLFFILSKRELLSYIYKLKAVYSGSEIESYFNLSFNHMNGFETHTLTKKEKDTLYINTLYLLADNSLDLKNKKAFNLITKEILKVTDPSLQ